MYAEHERKCRVCRRVVSDAEWRAVLTMLGFEYGAGVRSCSACVAKAQQQREQARERKASRQPTRPPIGLRVLPRLAERHTSLGNLELLCRDCHGQEQSS